MVCSYGWGTGSDCTSVDWGLPGSKGRAESGFTTERKVLNRAVWAMVTLCEKKDPYIAEHQLRVAQLAYTLGKELGLSEQQNEGICVMGMVHDIGKVVLPSEILNKPGMLSGEEFNLVKSHPKIGHEVLKNLEFPWPVAQAVLYHHERLDGSGYPAGLRGREIIHEAKILAVADVFDSMVSHRPYRPAHSLKEALEEIVRCRGILYDPDVVNCLCQISEKCHLSRMCW